MEVTSPHLQMMDDFQFPIPLFSLFVPLVHRRSVVESFPHSSRSASVRNSNTVTEHSTVRIYSVAMNLKLFHQTGDIRNSDLISAGSNG